MALTLEHHVLALPSSEYVTFGAGTMLPETGLMSARLFPSSNQNTRLSLPSHVLSVSTAPDYST